MNNDIDFVNEIMSDKKKFLDNVICVGFRFKKFENNNINNNMNLIADSDFSANDSTSLGDFYDIYKSRYGSLKIEHVKRLDGNEIGYLSVILSKEYSLTLFDYILYAEMLLIIRENKKE